MRTLGSEGPTTPWICKPTNTSSLPMSRPHTAGPMLARGPFTLLLSGLAVWTAITSRMYAQRKGWKLTTVEVEAEFFRDGAESRRAAHLAARRARRVADGAPARQAGEVRRAVRFKAPDSNRS